MYNLLFNCSLVVLVVIVVVWRGIHSRLDTNKIGSEDLSFFLSQAAVLPESDAGSDDIKPASGFVIQNHQTSCSMWCLMYRDAVSTWSAVCSEAPHSQFGEGARPHLCMDEWNRPTPVCKRLSLTQDARGKHIPTGLVPVPGTKSRSLEAFSQYSIFHL